MHRKKGPDLQSKLIAKDHPVSSPRLSSWIADLQYESVPLHSVIWDSQSEFEALGKPEWVGKVDQFHGDKPFTGLSPDPLITDLIRQADGSYGVQKKLDK